MIGLPYPPFPDLEGTLNFIIPELLLSNEQLILNSEGSTTKPLVGK